MKTLSFAVPLLLATNILTFALAKEEAKQENSIEAETEIRPNNIDTELVIDPKAGEEKSDQPNGQPRFSLDANIAEGNTAVQDVSAESQLLVADDPKPNAETVADKPEPNAELDECIKQSVSCGLSQKILNPDLEFRHLIYGKFFDDICGAHPGLCQPVDVSGALEHCSLETRLAYVFDASFQLNGQKDETCVFDGAGERKQPQEPSATCQQLFQSAGVTIGGPNPVHVAATGNEQTTVEEEGIGLVGVEDIGVEQPEVEKAEVEKTEEKLEVEKTETKKPEGDKAEKEEQPAIVARHWIA